MYMSDNELALKILVLISHASEQQRPIQPCTFTRFYRPFPLLAYLNLELYILMLSFNNNK